jgi:hypothetical protein
MLIDDIISKIGDGGPRSYYSFETFILNLFKYHIEIQGKPFQTESRPSFRGDAAAPEGFDDFIGYTLIEIKFDLTKLPPMRLFEKTVLRSDIRETEQSISNFLVLSAKPIRNAVRERYERIVSKLDLPFNVILWGPEEINKIVSKHRKQSKDIIDNLFALRLESAVSKQPTDWKKEREEIIENLKEFYSIGQFSLFLGAGVSSSAGVPDWNTLLNSLFVTYLTKEFDEDGDIIDEDIDKIVNRLVEVDEPSALVAARYLRRGLTKNKTEITEFINAITKNLYRLRDTSFRIDSSLINAIASLCIPRRTGAKVESVVTYNFDDLLERQLIENSIQFKSIYTESEISNPDELPVYHVHGFLPENRVGLEGLENSTLVFSEEGYHQIYSDPYHWSNLVQLNNLRENNCLMVGLSMTDPNLRRLLDISARHIEKTKHFAFMKRLTEKGFCYDEGSKVLTNDEAVAKFLERHHNLNEELMKELGVMIVWYEDHKEIPEMLEKIMSY